AGAVTPSGRSFAPRRAETCLAPTTRRYCLRLLPPLIASFCQCIVVYSGQPTRRLPVGRVLVAASGTRPDWNPAGLVKAGRLSGSLPAATLRSLAGLCSAPALRRGRLVEVSNAERWLAAVPKGRARPCLTLARFALRPSLPLALQATRMTRCLPSWRDASSASQPRAYLRCGSRATASPW